MGIRSLRRRLFGEHTSLILASVMVGLLAALAAVALKAGVNELTRLLHGWLFGARRELLTLLIPTAGLVLCVLFTRYWLNGDLGRGLPSLLRTIRERDSVVETHKLYSQVLTSILTMGAGGNGGMFGSSLFTGALTGCGFAHGVNLLGLAELNEVNFTVAGMAAVLSGTIHIPLTAIFLIAEITGGCALFVPLMIVASFSYVVSRSIVPYSVYGRPDHP